MFLEHKSLDLFGHALVVTAIVQGPMSIPNNMANEACYIFVKEGTMHSISPMHTVDIQCKDSVLMKCGNYIGRSIPDPETGRSRAVVVHLKPEILKKVYADGMPSFLKEGPDLQKTKSLARIKRDEIFSRFIDSILFYFENPELVSEEILVLKVKELLLLLANTRDAPQVHSILANLFQPQTVQFKDVIHANIFNEIPMEELALLTNLSLSSFKREFKRVFNDSPANYIRTKRLEKAAELLKRSDEQVSAIAYDSGFNDLSHFSKLFKRKYGMAPSDWRLGMAV